MLPEGAKFNNVTATGSEYGAEVNAQRKSPDSGRNPRGKKAARKGRARNAANLAHTRKPESRARDARVSEGEGQEGDEKDNNRMGDTYHQRTTRSCIATLRCARHRLRGTARTPGACTTPTTPTSESCVGTKNAPSRLKGDDARGKVADRLDPRGTCTPPGVEGGVKAAGLSAVGCGVEATSGLPS
ncbi:hypothetical protein K438DRAFT_1783426 [Mycena galopus ATCC 62051]|nr:hypothetical protein K438DRAFT_1783426 [Mycena galopus ATCC 62051]